MTLLLLGIVGLLIGNGYLAVKLWILNNRRKEEINRLQRDRAALTAELKNVDLYSRTLARKVIEQSDLEDL